VDQRPKRDQGQIYIRYICYIYRDFLMAFSNSLAEKPTPKNVIKEIDKKSVLYFFANFFV
jgi:hypothetical protein